MMQAHTSSSSSRPNKARSAATHRGKVKPIPRHVRITKIILLLFATASLGLSSLTLYVGICYGLSATLQDKLYTGKATATERAQLAKWRTQMRPFWDAWLVYDDLAQITLAQALQFGLTEPAGRALMPTVMQLEAQALRRQPANAFAWARLAYARYVYNGASRLVADPLWQSIQSAPYEPDLMPSRIVLALQTEEYWPDDMKALFPQQLERAWLRQSVEVVQAAYQDGVTDKLREKLQNAPEKLARFDELLGDLTPHNQQKP